MNKVKLSEMMWREVKQYLQNNSSILVPIGSTEQHGLHLPIGTDTIITEKVCYDVAKMMKLIVAPSIPYGVTLPLDKRMYGTSTLSEESLATFISDVIFNWRFQGFKYIILCTAHGDWHHIKALKSIRDTFLIELFDFKQNDLLEKQIGCRHAGESETSLMLYLYPSIVKTSEIKDFDVSFETFKPYLQHTKNYLRGYHQIGCVGAPSCASREKGEKIYQRLKDSLKSKIIAILGN